ncbi:STAS domain-containing protein [Saccharopolyspora spinosa]|uniref:Anti-anti-sigma factor n=2 Tax=Saccharopolyspora spinosa TaxID=60894 RepID=A0A2N3Y2A6_SACSN|nr:STAS domain-containing protein [Saccharopolyspora spinosa]PKW17042.1 anti-anti-sigma factor [Saccharopolyspora spinosa]
MPFAEFGRTEVPAPRTERSAEDLAPKAEKLSLRTTRPAPGVIVIEAAGILDMNSATQFAEAVRAHLTAATRTAVLDLSGLSFLSTDGVVVLMEAGHRALMRQANLVLVSQNRIVDRLLGILDITDRFTYASTADAAISAADATPALGEPVSRL